MDINKATGIIRHLAKGIAPEVPGTQPTDIDRAVLQADKRNFEADRQAQAIADYANKRHERSRHIADDRNRQITGNGADKKNSLQHSATAGSRQIKQTAEDREVKAMLDYIEKRNRH